jgi:hypothetical protein
MLHSRGQRGGAGGSLKSWLLTFELEEGNEILRMLNDGVLSSTCYHPASFCVK